MSIKNGVWHDAKLDPPSYEHSNKTVLIVKAQKSGQRVITFGAYNISFEKPRWEGTWSTNNGKGTVLYWMPLPKIPED
jgi:hypothetical protein